MVMRFGGGILVSGCEWNCEQWKRLQEINWALFGSVLLIDLLVGSGRLIAVVTCNCEPPSDGTMLLSRGGAFHLLRLPSSQA